MGNFFHDSAKISQLSSIEISSKGTHTYIGENSHVDDFVKIKHVGGAGDIRIGDNVYINSGCVFYSGNGIIIANNVLIGPNCNFTPVNHNFEIKDQLIREQGFMATKGGIIIEEDVWIGAGVTILDGSIIRKGCIIGANSLVNGDTAPLSIYFGIPIKFHKKR